MSDIEEQIRRLAKELLRGGKVDCVIGYGRSEEGRVRPLFAGSLEDAGKLVWNRSCANNLTAYLPENDGKVAIVVKGCDSRSLIELIKANQVRREDVFIIGVPCSGIETESGGGLLENCGVCRYRNPVICDVLIGERVEEVSEDDYEDVRRMESLRLEEKFRFWSDEFQRCIKCFACRNVCPICYCEECVLEKKKPQWVSKPRKEEDMFLFHLIRAFHVAGRCVDCGACERACPVGIPLRLLYRKSAKDVKEFFGYEAGLDPNEKPPLTEFNPQDDEKL